MEEELITAFEVFQIVLESGSSLVDRCKWHGVKPVEK